MITTGDGDGCYLEISDEMGAVGRFGDPNLLEVPAVHGSERGEVDAGAGDSGREHAVTPGAEPRQEVGVAHVVLDWKHSGCCEGACGVGWIRGWINEPIVAPRRMKGGRVAVFCQVSEVLLRFTES